MHGWVQGYNAQAACNEQHLIIAADVMTASPDFGHLEPMFTAARTELQAAGVGDIPELVGRGRRLLASRPDGTQSPPTASRC